jgi:hypothetical protein
MAQGPLARNWFGLFPVPTLFGALLETRVITAALARFGACGFAQNACTETISSALSRAYSRRPDFNPPRADARVRDEGLPKSGGWPEANANISASGASQLSRVRHPVGVDGFDNIKFSSGRYRYPTYSATLNVSQTVFRG